MAGSFESVDGGMDPIDAVFLAPSLNQAPRPVWKPAASAGSSARPRQCAKAVARAKAKAKAVAEASPSPALLAAVDLLVETLPEADPEAQASDSEVPMAALTRVDAEMRLMAACSGAAASASEQEQASHQSTIYSGVG